MTENPRPQPEAPRDLEGLDVLTTDFQAEIDAGAARLNLGDRIWNRLREPKVLAVLTLFGGAGAILTPGLIEGLANGMDWGEAIIYSVGTTPVTKTGKVYDINPVIEPLLEGDLKEFAALATREAVPKYMLEIRRYIVDALLFSTAVAAISKLRGRAKEKQNDILSGSAPIKRDSEQMFLMAGEGSPAVDLLTIALGEQALPIVENLGGAARILHRIATGDTSFGVNKRSEPQVAIFLNLDLEGGVDYMSSKGWQTLELSANNILRTSEDDDSRNILLIFGFGETTEEPLPLTDEVEQDLTVAETIEGTRKLQELAEAQGITINETIIVYLGNARRQRDRHTGVGVIEISDREAAKGINVFVDSRETFLVEMQRMLGGAQESAFVTGKMDYIANMIQDKKIKEEKAFAFVTGKMDYIANMIQAAKPTLTVYGKDNPAPVNEAGVMQTTAFVYEENVSESVETAKALQAQYRRVIVLSPTLEAHEKSLKAGIESLCIPLIYAEILLEIKKRIRNGQSAEDIQTALDETYPVNY